MAPQKKLRTTVVTAAVVTGTALLGAGLYPALANAGSPDLPDITEEQLLTKVAESEQQQLSGTVRVDAGSAVPMLDHAADALGGPAGSLAALAAGNATLHVAVDGPERQRIVLSDGTEEFSVIHHGAEVWAYDETEHTVYHRTLPQETQDALAERSEPGAEAPERLGVTPQDAAQTLLAAVEDRATVTADGTSRVADRDAYELQVEPDSDGQDALYGADMIRVAVDAETGVPLAVRMHRDGEQLLDVAFSRIQYEAPAVSTFDFTPPQGAEIVELADIAAFLPVPDGLPR